MTDAISIEDTKNWQSFRLKLNAAFAALGGLGIANVWTALQTFSAGALIKGTTTNDNAAAGYVGEYISSVVLMGAAITLTNNTTANITSIPLTGGDWDVIGAVAFTPNPVTTTSYQAGGISTVSAILPTAPSVAVCSPNPAAGQGTSYFTVPQTRISLAAPATIYLTAAAGFAVNAMAAFGQISARRLR